MYVSGYEDDLNLFHEGGVALIPRRRQSEVLKRKEKI